MDPYLFIPYVKPKIIGVRDLRDNLPSYLCNNHYYMVMHYGVYTKGIRDNTQPKVILLIKAIDIKTGKYIKNEAVIKISSTYIGTMRIGSVWKFSNSGNLAVARYIYQYDKVEFLVNYNKKTGWDLYFPKEGEPHILDVSSHQISSKYDNYIKGSPMIRFYLKDGYKYKNLYISCSEFFHRTYGSSGFIKRKLLTFDLDNVMKIISNSIERTVEMSGLWIINPSSSLRKGDYKLLASLMYDKHTQQKVRYIYSQLENSKKYKYLWVFPWFSHIGELSVSGFELNEDTFIGLRVEGSSFPKKEIFKIKNKTNSSDNGNKKGEEGTPTGPVKPGFDNEGFEQEQDEPPGSSGNSFDLYEDPMNWKNDIAIKEFEIFNDSDVNPGHLQGIKDCDEELNDETNYQTGSSGDPSGEENNIKKTDMIIHNDHYENNTLLQIWLDFNLAQKQNPSNIKSIEYYTYQNRFKSDGYPKLISFPKISELSKEDKSNIFKRIKHRERKRWLFANGKLRGALILKVKTTHKVFYIVEIERKFKSDKSKESESYKGLSFTLDEQIELDETLIIDILEKISMVKGIVKDIPKPSKVKLFESYPHYETKLIVEKNNTNKYKQGFGFGYAINKIFRDMKINLVVSIDKKIKRITKSKNIKST